MPNPLTSLVTTLHEAIYAAGANCEKPMLFTHTIWHDSRSHPEYLQRQPNMALAYAVVLFEPNENGTFTFMSLHDVNFIIGYTADDKICIRIGLDYSIVPKSEYGFLFATTEYHGYPDTELIEQYLKDTGYLNG